MNKLLKKLLIISSIFVISIVGLYGCDQNKATKTYETYKAAWIKKDYKTMFSMLSAGSKIKTTEKKFITRFNNIYSSIGATNIKIEDPKTISKDKAVKLNISIDTLAGTIKGTTSNITLVEEDGDYKVVWDDSLILPQLVAGDKVRTKIDPGERGSIFDKQGNLLAGKGDVKQINIALKEFEEDKENNIKQMADILDISEETIIKKIDKHTNKEHQVHIVDISNNQTEKIEKLLAMPGVKIPTLKSRVYNGGEALGALVGYVSNITAEQLEKNPNKKYHNYSKIGKFGIEKVYEDTLRATDGIKIFIEKETGDKQTVIESQKQNGKDVKLSIDTELQQKVYEEMNKEKGSSVSVDPKTGEVLAMVSSPSFDSNTMVTYTTKSDKKRWDDSKNSEFENRFNNVYSPGSVMKLVTASIGLDNKKLDPNKSIDIKGKSWDEYKVTRVTDPQKPVNLIDATKYSDNIYFAKAGLEIGDKAYIEGAKKFGIGKKLKFDYPMSKTQISNSGKLDDKNLLVDTAYGQGEVMVSSLDIALIYSSLGNEGNIMNPRLDITSNNSPSILSQAINKNNLPTLQNAFTAVINDSDGTASDSKIDGFNIAGKTGTAEIKKSKDDTSGTENGWFVAVNLDDSKICTSMILEDVKNKGGSHAVNPKVKNIMEYYLKK